MTTTNTATQKPKKGNGATKQAAVMMAGMDLPSGDDNIAVAAYYRAEQRGFAPGDELADWLQAEAECKSSPS